MIGQAVRRSAAPAARRLVNGRPQQVRRLRIDQPDAPNRIIQKQRELQGGATPYLRGDADPTYLRKGQSDMMIVSAFGIVTAFSWLYLARAHYRLWENKK